MFKGLIIIFILAYSGLVLSAPTQQEVADMKKIVGYFPSWGVYAGHREYFVSEVPWEKLTHVNVAFASTEKDTFKVASADPWADNDNPYGEKWESEYTGNYGQLKKLKTKYPHVSVLVSIGGWTLSDQFALIDTDVKRKLFTDSAIAFMIKNSLDGLDIDWEFPNKVRAPDYVDIELDRGTPHEIPASKQNFTLLLEALRNALDDQGALDDRYYQLTAAVGSSPSLIRATEPDKYAEYLDFINIMSYDMHGAWEDRTNHHSPIFANPNLPNDGINVANAATILTDEFSVPASKIIIGSPFYSRGWKNVECKDEATVSYVDANYVTKTKTVENVVVLNKDGTALPGLNCHSMTGAAGRWDGGRAAGVNSWYDIAKEIIGKDGFQVYRDQYSKVPYLYSEEKKEFYTYEDVESVRARANFVNDNNYGGIIIWELSADTRPKLGDPDLNLLDGIYDVFYNGADLSDTLVGDSVNTGLEFPENSNDVNEGKTNESKAIGKGAAVDDDGISTWDPNNVGDEWGGIHYNSGDQVEYSDSGNLYICTAPNWIASEPVIGQGWGWSCELQALVSNTEETPLSNAEVDKINEEAEGIAADLANGNKDPVIDTTTVSEDAASSSGAGVDDVNGVTPTTSDLQAASTELSKCHSGQVYNTGDVCNASGSWYKFNWWTKYNPSVMKSGMESITAPENVISINVIPALGLKDWKNGTTYSKSGMMVTYEAGVFKSKYWTAGNIPKRFNSDGPWEFMGVADVTLTGEVGTKAPTPEEVLDSVTSPDEGVIRSDDDEGTTASHDNETGGTIISEYNPEAGSPTNSSSAADGMFYMPFVDAVSWPPYDPMPAMKDDNVKNFAFSFVNSSGGICEPTWGNFKAYPIDNDTLNMPNKIDAIAAGGGTSMISFGGAIAHQDELPQACNNVLDLTAAYQSVIDKTGVKMIDFDIEGANSYNTNSVVRRMKALKVIQDNNEGIEISFTLATMPTGLLENSGLMILKTAIENGVEFSAVNLMLMDYGTAFPANVPGALQMAAYSIQALESVNAQLKVILSGKDWAELKDGDFYHLLGAIPMIGRNDTLNEWFYKDDVEKLVEWSNRKGIRMMSMWSLNRDVAIGSDESATTKLFKSTKLPISTYGSGLREFSKILMEGRK